MFSSAIILAFSLPFFKTFSRCCLSLSNLFISCPTGPISLIIRSVSLVFKKEYSFPDISLRTFSKLFFDISANIFIKFREKRKSLRSKNKKITGLALTDTLKNYAQTGSEYTKILNQIITQNRLSDFELVRLVNSVKQVELNS